MTQAACMRPGRFRWFAPFCLAIGLAGCGPVGGLVYEVQMRCSDAVALDDGTWSEIDLAMTEGEKACMAASCAESKVDQATYTGCFKQQCRAER